MWLNDIADDLRFEQNEQKNKKVPNKHAKFFYIDADTIHTLI